MLEIAPKQGHNFFETDHGRGRRWFKSGLPFTQIILTGWMPSKLKAFYYRMRGAKIGKNVSFGIGCVIDAGSIEIGDGSKIGPFTFIKTVGECRIGKRSRIGAFVAIETGAITVRNDSIVMEQVVIGGMLTPRSRIDIGSRVKIFPFCFLNPTEPITIEDDVGVGGGTYIFTHGTWQSMLDGFPGGFGPVTLKNGVWLPWRVFIMPGVTIGEFATIGAGSIVTKSIPDRTLAVGSPAKALKSGEEYVKAPSAAGKDQFIRTILNEFVEYMNYIGNTGFLTENGDPSSISIFSRRFNARLIYLQNTEPNLSCSAGDLVLSLPPLNPELRTKISGRHAEWFDLSSYACSVPASDFGKELRNFLGRYGMRFAVDGEN